MILTYYYDIIIIIIIIDDYYAIILTLTPDFTSDLRRHWANVW